MPPSPKHETLIFLYVEKHGSDRVPDLTGLQASLDWNGILNESEMALFFELPVCSKTAGHRPHSQGGDITQKRSQSALTLMQSTARNESVHNMPRPIGPTSYKGSVASTSVPSRP